MELAELENIIKGYDKKIDENISLNRDVLKRLLINKPHRCLQVERLKTLYQLCSPLLLPCLVMVIIEVLNIGVDFTSNFYIGLGLFVPTFLFVWSLNIKHYLLIRKINFSTPVILIKRQVAELEKYSIWMTKIRNMLTPILISGMLLVFVPQSIYVMEFVLMVGFITSIFILSAFYKNYSIRERYRVVISEIEELEALGKS